MMEELPSSWLKTTIGGIYQVIGGGTPSTKVQEYWQGDIPWITSADIKGVRAVQVSRYITEEAIEKSTTNKVPPETLLVVTRVGLGKIAIADSYICFSQDLQGLIAPAELISSQFALYYLSFALQSLKYEGRGTTISGITKKQLKDTILPIPPFNEQERIVAKIEELLSELDKGIESLQTVHEQLKVYRQAILKHAFEGKLTADWREEMASSIESVQVTIASIETPPRPNRWKTRSNDVIFGHSALAVNNPRTVLPEGWIWTPLVNVAKMESGHTPSRRHPEWWDGDIKWIGIADARLRHGKTINDTIQHTNEEGLANSAARLLPKGTVCVSRTASVGYVVTMGDEMATSQDFVNWVPTETVTSEWLSLIFSADRETLRRFGKGTTHKTIYFPEWMSVNIALPPVSEQMRIVEEVNKIFSVLEKQEEIVDDTLGQSEALRQSILKQAFSGKLVAQNPNDEPASVLLDRINSEKEKNGKMKKGKAA